MSWWEWLGLMLNWWWARLDDLGLTWWFGFVLLWLLIILDWLWLLLLNILNGNVLDQLGLLLLIVNWLVLLNGLNILNHLRLDLHLRHWLHKNLLWWSALDDVNWARHPLNSWLELMLDRNLNWHLSGWTSIPWRCLHYWLHLLLVLDLWSLNDLLLIYWGIGLGLLGGLVILWLLL